MSIKSFEPQKRVWTPSSVSPWSSIVWQSSFSSRKVRLNGPNTSFDKNRISNYWLVCAPSSLALLPKTRIYKVCPECLSIAPSGMLFWQGLNPNAKQHSERDRRNNQQNKNFWLVICFIWRKKTTQVALTSISFFMYQHNLCCSSLRFRKIIRYRQICFVSNIVFCFCSI